MKAIDNAITTCQMLRRAASRPAPLLRAFVVWHPTFWPNPFLVNAVDRDAARYIAYLHALDANYYPPFIGWNARRAPTLDTWAQDAEQGTWGADYVPGGAEVIEAVTQ